MAVTLKDIREARKLLQGVAHVTRLDYSRTFSELMGYPVCFKMENMQKTGSFKIRGAYNKISRLSPEEKARGVVAASAGNHAQGVAYAARQAGIECTIVMPVGAPITKLMATKGYGARVETAGQNYDEAFDRAVALQEERGLTLVHAFDDEAVIAGQGTVGLELLNEEPDLEAVVVPIGGGGIISGIALACKKIKPSIKIYGVQSSHAPSMYLAVKAGERVAIDSAATIADGIAVKRPGEITYKLVQKYVDDIVTVTDEEVAQSILMLLERSKVMAEGAGAAGLAACLEGKIPARGKTAVVITGGNIDVNILSIIIERGLIKSGRYARLETVISDRPGALQQLLGVIASTRANIISVVHDRIEPHVPLKQASVELALETMDAGHITEIMMELRKSGYTVTNKTANEEAGNEKDN